MCRTCSRGESVSRTASESIERIRRDKDAEGRPAFRKANLGFENIAHARQNDTHRAALTAVVHPTNIDSRMTARKSVFTVHGKNKKSVGELAAGKDIPREYAI